MTVETAPAQDFDLNQLLGGAPLPALPQSAVRLLELARDPENGPGEFAVPIEADAGLAAQVLKFVNSSYFGFSREISSVKYAVNLVGIRTVKNFALWSAVFSLMPNPKCGPFDLRSLWQDSLRRALLARRVTPLLGSREAEEAFAAALLQDMAVPLLARARPTEYVRLLERRQAEGRRLSDLEREQFGFDHAQVAAHLIRAWNMPESLAVAIAEHTSPLDGTSEPGEATRLAVGLSAMLPSVCDDEWTEYEQFSGAYGRLIPTGPALPELLTAIDRQYGEMAPLMKLSVPSRSLHDWAPSVV